MHWSCFIRSALVALIVTTSTHGIAQVTTEQVRRAIDNGVGFLKSRQDRTGGWSRGSQPNWGKGDTALCTLALLNCGVPLDDPTMQKAMQVVRRMNTKRTYPVALQTMVLCNADPKRDLLTIRENVRWLERTQVRDGFGKGGWNYNGKPTGADNSNSQFAMLALYEAELVGIDVREQTWRLARNYWTNQQKDDGSWSYQPAGQSDSTGSMTCAGVASLLIANMQIGEGDAVADGAEVRCCQPHQTEEGVARAMKWLGDHFTVRENPGSPGWWLYYLYALERTGRLSGQRFIGLHDWYREGAELLVNSQDPVGAWRGKFAAEALDHVGTSLSLLFLAKGRRPVLIAKAKRLPDSDWNYHRNDLTYLTHHVEQRWKQRLTWQTIDLDIATIEDLAQIPVLYLSGQHSLRLNSQQKENLKQYIANGGFIFAESCCEEGGGFDRDFRRLMDELYPDSPLRLLPQDHPVWYAEQRVNPKYLRPLLGVDACCRTSVIYSPQKLSCYWELAGGRRYKDYPKQLQEEIDACLAIAANIVTYATQRELNDKLSTPILVGDSEPPETVKRGVLAVAKLLHAGGSDDAPNALTNLLKSAREQIQLPILTEKILLPTTHESLPDYPIVFTHGRRRFAWSEQEREALARYLNNGGFLFADAICASEEFAQSFRKEMKAIFPDSPLQRLPPDHPIFTDAFQGHDLSRVALRDPSLRGDRLTTKVKQVPPTLEAIERNGRIVVIFSPHDMSCALENQSSFECKGYSREDAARLGMNILLFAMQQ